MSLFTASPSSSGSQITVNGLVKTTPEISNTVLVLAATEYAINLPDGCVEFRLRARGVSKLQFSYTTGQSGITYVTIYPGSTHVESRLFVASLVLYVQATKAGEVVELTTWTN